MGVGCSVKMQTVESAMPVACVSLAKLGSTATKRGSVCRSVADGYTSSRFIGVGAQPATTSLHADSWDVLSVSYSM
jgi:hypothetical protein